ncbi:MAG TPA: hypothetical protein VF588_04560 [Pyrinomonadaceae bacterium]|jgi:hypothetical protein
MLYWLSSSKVRLGLLVNGLYLFSLFVPSPSQVGGRLYPNDYARPDFARPKRPPISVFLTPPTGPTKATSYRDGSGVLTVYLDKELTLQSSPGHVMTLSPTFTIRGDGSPDAVLLHFISYNRERSDSLDGGLLIRADGRLVWPAAGPDGDLTWNGWKEELVPAFVTENGGFYFENVGKTIPYEVFAEVIGAKSVVFSLGPYNVKLRDEQLEALRDMHRLWAAPPAPAGVRKRF